VFQAGEKSKVFSQYNISIIIVFLLIVFSAFSVTTYRYFSDLAEYKKEAITDLSTQVNNLNKVLTSHAEALLSIQKVANYFLASSKELSIQALNLSQDGEHYYVNKESYDLIGNKNYVRNNITGIGNIHQLDNHLKTELAMSNMLTPAFVTAKQINDEAVWFYYISKKRFVSIYPSVNRSSWQYSDILLEGEHTQSILNTKKNASHIVWSTPYAGASGNGLNTSLGTGVVDNTETVGVLYIDISLSKLTEHLDNITQENMGVIVLNENNDVLIHHKLQGEAVNSIEKWQRVAPATLSQLTNQRIDELTVYQEIDDWLVQKQVLPVNGWKVIKYQRYSGFRDSLISHFSMSFLTLFASLFVFLLFVYWVTHRAFIKPTQRFISHIEYCAQGDPGKIKPTSDWLRWFQVVENIFGQNRSLLQRLTDQNLLLDTRVHEKTQELQEKISQHKRDYALLRSVMNAIPEYIIFNDIDGNIVGFNDAFGDFIKKNREEVLGFKANEIILNELGTSLTELSRSDAIKDGVQRVVQTHSNTYDIFCTHIHSDTGIEVGTIDIIRDVTTQYAIQAALKKTKDQAEFANKAKSQFLANMSHEIRTPINAIQGMITLLGRSVLTNNQRQHIDNAYGASKSLLYLVDQLLDLAKIESGEMTIVKEKTSLDSIINKAIKLNIGMIHQKNLELIVDVSPSVPLFVETDEMRLIQVLTNLLQNSVKFTQAGSITICVDTIFTNKTISEVVFKIKDTGIGIALDKQSYLFEAFKQADESMTRQYGGSGLGLSICQQIVHLLNGDISLESELNKGCEFTIKLPFELSTQNLSNTLLPKLALYSYRVDLPASLYDIIEDYGWVYQSLSRIEEMAEQPTQQSDVALLIAEKDVAHFIANAPKSNIQLLCICQTSEKHMRIRESLLEQLTVPYILQEKPVYRHMLNAISKSIYRLNKAELADTHQESENLEGVVVLLVEDNLVNQLVAKELLLSMRAEVIIAENGKVALDLLDKNSIDIVLMDIQMPVMDGLTAAKLMRKQYAHNQLPIVAMTAHARNEDRDRSLEAGMNLHMAKPVKYDTLLQSILELLRCRIT